MTLKTTGKGSEKKPSEQTKNNGMAKRSKKRSTLENTVLFLDIIVSNLLSFYKLLRNRYKIAYATLFPKSLK